MPADDARPRIGRVALAVELYEGAVEGHIFARGVAVIALEVRYRLVGHIGPAGRQLGIHRVAEILRAVDTVGEIRDALQIATAAMPRWYRAKRAVSFADDIKAPPKSTRPRGIHGEVAGILDRAVADFFQVKRPRPLQHHGGDLTVAFADMGLEPSRNIWRLLHGKRSGRPRQGDDDDETDDTDDSYQERS